MNINIKTNKNFTTSFNKITEKYGEEFEYLNGFHDSQMNYSDFIDGFVDKNISEITIDANANASNKDIASLLSEKGKSHDKLLAFNKIFYEMNKKYGLDDAREWLESEYNGAYYLHDAPSTTYKPYCFKGDTKILTKNGIKKLEELVDKNIEVLNKNHGWESATVKEFGKAILKKLTLERYGVTKDIYVTGNHVWFVKDNTGDTIEVSTDNLKVGMKIPFNTSKVWSQVEPSPFGVAHGFITGDGYKSDTPRANFCGDKTSLIPYFTPANITGTENEKTIFAIPKYFNILPSLSETPSYLYGWLSGYFAADGSVDEKGRCTISSINKENLEFVRDVLCVLGMPVNEIRYQDRVSNLTNEMGRVYLLTLSSEYLKGNFFIRPIHKKRYKETSDRKNRSWIVKSIESTGIEETVYCAVVDGTQSFTLDNNVLTHNCYAYDLTRLATEGLFFLNNYNPQPPKHLTTYLDDVIEFVSYMCNRSSGAVGLPNLLIWSFYFWKKDCENGYCIKDKDYYLRQCFQKLIYRLNQPFLRVDQSSFTNVSIFDSNYIESLFGGVEFPDGTFVIDFINEIIEHQKVFMEVISEIRSENMFTFPVLTYSLLYKDNKFVDEKFARWCSDHNTKWNDSNFFISDNVTTLSNCCFDGDQKILAKSSDGVIHTTLKKLYEAPYHNAKVNLTAFHNGSWLKAKVIALPKRPMYKITTVNNKILMLTDNHINVTLSGEKTTDKLTTNDYLMFNNMALDTFPEKDEGLTYNEGFLIGMYLGDGSMANEDKDFTTQINLSINKEKYLASIDILSNALDTLKINAEIKLGKPYNNVYPVSITNNRLAEFIRRFVKGKYCFEKELDLNCLLQSRKFRKGIIDGLYLTDGGNSNRIYTTSSMLAEQIECLMTSLGTQSVIDITDRTDEKVVIREQEFNRNYPLYCIRWYSSGNKRSNSDRFVIRNNSTYFKIKSIEPYETKYENVYCFEMPVQEPYFTLPNGIITHNCRLLSDTSKLDAFINSIGGTALSIGSVKVNTTNLMRIYYETGKDELKYLEQLRHRIELCCKTLDCIRHIIQRNIEKGLLPNYQDGGMEMTKQYNTVGILGLFEVIKSFGYTTIDKFGYTSYTDEGIEFASKIFEVINDVKDNFTNEYSLNVESVPAERCAVILCAKDNTLFKPKTDTFIYSNQWIPLTVKCTLSEKLKLSSILDKKCGGGAIAHINISNIFPNTDTAWNMLNEIAQSGVIYFAFNTKINECKNHHGFIGTDICPNCGEPVFDTYQRIVGFLVPSRSYSKDRYKEFTARQWYEDAELRGDR